MRAVSGVQNKRASQPSAENKQPDLFWFLHTTACWILLALGLVLLSEQVLAASHQLNDFCQDYIAARRLSDGIPPYLPLHLWTSYQCSLPVDYNGHPPSSVFFFLPFSLLPRVPASLAWGFCLLTAYLISGILLLRALGWYSLRSVALFIIGSVYWQPLIGAQQAQNLWQVLLLLLVGAWLLERQGRTGWAGLLLGIAVLLKVWPIVLVLGALARRQWRSALLGGWAVVVGTALALVFMGPEAEAVYLGPVRASETVSVPVVGNISLPGAVVRFFAGDPTLQMGPVVHGLMFNQAIFMGEILAGFLLMMSVAFIVWCFHRCKSEVLSWLSQGFLITIVLLIFPLTWHFGLIILLLPCTLLILALRKLPRPPRWWVLLLVLSLLPLVVPYSLFALGLWIFEQQSAGMAWLAMFLFALPTLGLMGFAGAQGYLLWRSVTPRSL